VDSACGVECEELDLLDDLVEVDLLDLDFVEVAMMLLRGVKWAAQRNGRHAKLDGSMGPGCWRDWVLVGAQAVPGKAFWTSTR
jgi:hypothetical protein